MKTAIALGTFDGLHIGHQAVIKKTAGFYSIAVTFDALPKREFVVLPQLLMLPEEREKNMKQLGINQVHMQNFEAVCNIPAEQYLEQLKQKYNPQRIVCGFNYTFGKDAKGDTAMLDAFCKKNSIEFICVSAIECDGDVVSSTRIRDLVRSGKTKEAASMIYGGFGFEAPVIHGDARGRTFGFPTANQEYPKGLIRPKYGVYLTRVTINGEQYKAITNIGIRPTYRTSVVGCETFIKDYSEEIYGELMKTEFLDFVREEREFSSSAELAKAILNDVKLLED